MPTARTALVLLASLPLGAALATAAGCHGRVATAVVTHRMMSEHAEQKKLSTLLQANDAFYSGLNDLCAGNADAVLAVWSRASDVSDFGPDGQKHVGWEAVEAQFRKEAGMKMGGSVACEDVRFIEGSDWGVATCTEVGRGMIINGKPADIHFRSTNVFRKEGDEWKMVHHHTDPSVPMEAKK